MVEILLSFWDGLFSGDTVCLFQGGYSLCFTIIEVVVWDWKNLNPSFKKSFKVDVFVLESIIHGSRISLFVLPFVDGMSSAFS